MRYLTILSMLAAGCMVVPTETSPPPPPLSHICHGITSFDVCSMCASVSCCDTIQECLYDKAMVPSDIPGEMQTSCDCWRFCAGNGNIMATGDNFAACEAKCGVPSRPAVVLFMCLNDSCQGPGACGTLPTDMGPDGGVADSGPDATPPGGGNAP